jgi:hypothetical protein
MAKYTALLDVFHQADGRDHISDDDLETLEAECRKLRAQRGAAIGLCATLLRGISMQGGQPTRATAILAAAKADYEALIKAL